MIHETGEKKEEAEGEAKQRQRFTSQPDHSQNTCVSFACKKKLISSEMETIKFHDCYNIDITKVLNATLNDITMKSVAKVGSNNELHLQMKVKNYMLNERQLARRK